MLTHWLSTTGAQFAFCSVVHWKAVKRRDLGVGGTKSKSQSHGDEEIDRKADGKDRGDRDDGGAEEDVIADLGKVVNIMQYVDHHLSTPSCNARLTFQ